MRSRYLTVLGLSLALPGGIALAQPPGITPEMINTTLPLEGAPLAEPGPYAVTPEAAFGSPGHLVFRPASLDTFGVSDTLPVLVWGNGGCAIDGSRYGEFLGTIASHGFLVVTTVPTDGGPQRQGANELAAALDWAEAENLRDGSPLKGKVDTAHMAVMGQSCGGFLSIALGGDPRVGTIGAFNSGVQPPASGGNAAASTDDLAKLHGPALFINGHERDFLMEVSRANYDLVSHVPTFYGARHNAGHTATVFHPGGGEYANVASRWLRYHFKGDVEAGRMFTGADCLLCVDPEWDTASKGL